MKVLLTDDSDIRGYARKVKTMARILLEALNCTEAEISIVLTGDIRIRELNKKYLNKDRATDVLSFPMEDETLLGDVVISLERAADQARELDLSVEQEIARLLIHGTLHLLGYDHVNGGRQAGRMKRLETELYPRVYEGALS